MTGKILDNANKEPIYGVAVLCNKNIVCFSDIDGSFNFKIDSKDANPNIQFKHISYLEFNKKYDDILKINNVILLKENISNLNEVVISASTNDRTLKNILKFAVEKFGQTYRESPYWSALNYKQLIYLNGNSHSYLEFDGHIFMVGDNHNPFLHPLIVPDQIRRTRESENIVKSWFSNSGKSDFFKTQLGQSEATHGWMDYSFLESVHPLGKKFNTYFDFNLVKSDDNFYKLKFKQKRTIKIATRSIENVQGELLLTKNDFILSQLTVNYRFDEIYYVGFNIDYKLIDGKLYPYTVEKSRFAFKSFNNEQLKVVLNSFSVFDHINLVERKNYRKDFAFGPWYSISKTYNQKYWESKPISTMKYKNAIKEIVGDSDESIVFTEGAHTREYNSNIKESTINYLEKKGAELKNIMNKDLKE